MSGCDCETCEERRRRDVTNTEKETLRTALRVMTDARYADVAALRARLDGQRALWESLAASVESALSYHRTKGGQHAGTPGMVGVPISQLKVLERLCSDAIVAAGETP